MLLPDGISLALGPCTFDVCQEILRLDLADGVGESRRMAILSCDIPARKQFE